MEEFRSPQPPPPPPPTYKSYHGGRNLEIVDPTTLRSINKVYVTRVSPPSRPYSFDHRYQFPNKISSRPKKSSSSFKGWWNDPEVERKRRVAKYKFYSTEGKVKASLRKGFRWVKIQCSKIIHGF